MKEILTRPDMIPQYELLSRLAIPAVQAAVWELEPLIETFDTSARTYAIQSSGALIGDILTERGFRIARDERGENRRGRVRNARFIKTGTIWEPPTKPDDAHSRKVEAIVESIMVRYRTTLSELAK